VLPEEDNAEAMVFLFEFLGYLLVPSSKMQRALMLLGPGDTGKSTLLTLTEHLLGPSNVSHHSLQSICDDRFTAADLYGRIANICADLDAKSIGNSGKFKMIVSGDPMSAEFKFKDPFKYRPFARLLFSANEAPGTSDQSDAYYKRWLVLPMTRKLAREDQDPDLVESITSPEEMAGVLRYAVAGLRQLFHRGRFDPPPSMEAAASKYRADTDTVVAFVEGRCALGSEGRIGVTALFEDYRDWCTKNNRRELGMQRFKEHLLATYDTLDVRKLHGVMTVHGISSSAVSDLGHVRTSSGAAPGGGRGGSYPYSETGFTIRVLASPSSPTSW
jgi:putative DNA primase/helicase